MCAFEVCPLWSTLLSKELLGAPGRLISVFVQSSQETTYKLKSSNTHLASKALLVELMASPLRTRPKGSPGHSAASKPKGATLDTAPLFLKATWEM